MIRLLGVIALIAGCSPPMQSLSEGALAAAEARWQAHGVSSYHLVLRVRPPRAKAVVYDVEVAGGRVVRMERDDARPVGPDELATYTISGLFQLVRRDLPLLEARLSAENLPPTEARVHFDNKDGRLLHYRRTLGAARRRVLYLELLAFEPTPPIAG